MLAFGSVFNVGVQSMLAFGSVFNVGVQSMLAFGSIVQRSSPRHARFRQRIQRSKNTKAETMDSSTNQDKEFGWKHQICSAKIKMNWLTILLSINQRKIN